MASFDFEIPSTVAEYPKTECLHHLFEQQVDKNPQNIAIFKENGKQLTYETINQMSNKLAHYILERYKPKHESLVTVLLESRADYVIANLAIWKAGCVYIPLIQECPLARLNYILSDTQSLFIISETAIIDRIGISWPNIILLDDVSISQAIELFPATNPDPHSARTTDLAYIIYTSGSTGTPKGVMVQHDSIVNFCYHYESESNDVSALYVNPAFDPSVMDTWPFLIVGAALHEVPSPIRLDPGKLVEWMDQASITVCFLTTRLGVAVIEHVFRNTELAPRKLRWLIVGGEKLHFNFPVEHVPFKIINQYGPTEATVFVSTFHVNGLHSTKEYTQRPPIGKLLPNIKAYILDEEKNPAQNGELYIGGECLGRGYLNLPELTAAKFLPDPFDSNPDARMYRTGDLVCIDELQNLHYKGRVDNQIKIRGYLIEPLEIETALTDNTESIVDQVVVIPISEPGNAHLQLLACLLVKSEKNSYAEVIEKYKILCKERLPNYMWPAHWICIDHLPLTCNRKADREAIIRHYYDYRRNITQLAANRSKLTGMELQIAKLWALLLDHPLHLIDSTTNFFDIGGHSFLIIQIKHRIISQYDISGNNSISTADIFAKPVLRDLAAYVEQFVESKDVTPRSNAICNEKIENVIGYKKPSEHHMLKLSYSQKLLWLHMEKECSHEMYVNAESIGFPKMPELNIRHLENAINNLLRRHCILRAQILKIDGKTRQHFLPYQRVPLPLLEFTDKTDAEKFASSKCKEVATSGYPLIQFYMCTMNYNTANPQQKLMIVFHHCILDGVSISNVLLPELVQFYMHQDSGVAAPAPLKFEFEDYINQERLDLKSDSVGVQQAMEYWETELNDLIPFKLNGDKVTSQPQGNTPASVFIFTLNSNLVNKIRCLCREHNTTMYIALLASLKLLLFRFTGQTNISILGVSSGRNSLEAENLIGQFTNILLFRDQLASEDSFLDILLKIHKTCLKAYRFQHIPFIKCLPGLRISRPGLVDNISSVMFSMNLDTPSNPLNWNLKQMEEYTSASKYDISIDSLEEVYGQIKIKLEFNKLKFSRKYISALTSHWSTLLQEVVDSPSTLIKTVKLIPESERSYILRNWSKGNEIGFPNDQCIHKQFEAQVSKYPDHTAVRDSQESLTYAELNDKANKISSEIGQFVKTQEELVAILLPQSCTFVACVLAILKSGAAFVPISEDYPLARIKYILKDTQATLLISSSGIIKNVGLDPDETRLLLINSTEHSAICDDVHILPAIPQSTTSLAYVIFTSGSTGNPKGVMVEHKNVLNFAWWNIRKHNLGPQDRSSILVSPTFDLTIFEMFPVLLSGGCLCIPSSLAIKLKPKELIQWLADEGVTICYLTKVIAEQILKADKFPSNLALNVLYIGGESLTYFPHTSRPEISFEIVNSYGPAEVTVTATELNLRGYKAISSIPPVGRPLDNYSVYILDSSLEPVPLGITGELYFSGMGVARGYLNMPDITKTKFVPNPFKDIHENPSAHETMYRSGDLGCWLHDGTILFQGRLDNQVKVRGYLVELGEIEAQIKSCPEVDQVIVITNRADNPEGVQIVAYVQPTSKGKDVFAEDLKRRLKSHLKSTLPAFMMPSHWVLLEDLPVTTNGKIDTKSLPQPEYLESDNFVPPKTNVQQKLVEIFAQVLRRPIPTIGVKDNFFDIGGNSLLAAIVVEEIEHKLGSRISLRSLFTDPTVGELSEILTLAINQVAQFSNSLITLHTPLPLKCRSPAVIFIHPVGGTVFCYKPLVTHLQTLVNFSGCKFFAIQDPSIDAGEMLFESIQSMATSYGKLIQTIDDCSGQCILVGYSFGGLVAYEMAKMLGRNKVESIILLDATTTRRQLSNELDVDALMKYYESIQSAESESNKCDQILGLTKLRMKMCLNYSPTPLPPGFRILLLKAEDQNEEAFAAVGEEFPWQKVCIGNNYEESTVPGNHYTMMTEPHVLDLANRISTFRQILD